MKSKNPSSKDNILVSPVEEHIVSTPVRDNIESIVNEVPTYGRTTTIGELLNDLLNEPVDNQYVEVLKMLIKKLSFFINCIEKLSKMNTQDPDTQNFHQIFEN